MNRLLLALVLAVVPGFAVPTHIQHNVTNSSSTVVSSWSTAFSSNNTAGNTLIVFVSGLVNSGTLTGFSASDTQGNTWSAASPFLKPAGLNPVQIFYASNCKAGANTVTITATGTTPTLTYLLVAVHEYSGISNSSPIDAEADASGFTGSSVSAGPITTTAANDLIFLGAIANTITSAGTGFTMRCNQSGSATEDQVLTSPGSITGLMNTTGGWTAQIVAFKAAGASNPGKGRIWVE